MDVVVFVRDRKKLERILYEEKDLVVGNLVEHGNAGMKNSDGGGEKKRNGATVVCIFRRNIARWLSNPTHSTERNLEEVEKEQQTIYSPVEEAREQ